MWWTTLSTPNLLRDGERLTFDIRKGEENPPVLSHREGGGGRNIFLGQKIKELYLETCTDVSQLFAVNNSVSSEFWCGQEKDLRLETENPSLSVTEEGGRGGPLLLVPT